MDKVSFLQDMLDSIDKGHAMRKKNAPKGVAVVVKKEVVEPMEAKECEKEMEGKEPGLSDLLESFRKGDNIEDIFEDMPEDDKKDPSKKLAKLWEKKAKKSEE